MRADLIGEQREGIRVRRGRLGGRQLQQFARRGRKFRRLHFGAEMHLRRRRAGIEDHADPRRDVGAELQVAIEDVLGEGGDGLLRLRRGVGRGRRHRHGVGKQRAQLVREPDDHLRLGRGIRTDGRVSAAGIGPDIDDEAGAVGRRQLRQRREQRGRRHGRAAGVVEALQRRAEVAPEMAEDRKRFSLDLADESHRDVGTQGRARLGKCERERSRRGEIRDAAGVGDAQRALAERRHR